MRNLQAASQWREVQSFWVGLDFRVKLAAVFALAISVVGIALPLTQSTFATGPAVLSSVAFGQWAVALAGPARLLITHAPTGEPDASAAELARGRAPVLTALACALPGWLALVWHAGLGVGLVVLFALALEFYVVRYLRRAVRR